MNYELLGYTITQLQACKRILENELGYNCNITDDIQTVIEHLEFDMDMGGDEE